MQPRVTLVTCSRRYRSWDCAATCDPGNMQPRVTLATCSHRYRSRYIAATYDPGNMQPPLPELGLCSHV
ncbi:hypothetical protein NDU88_005841 [Pleurodeles waltl]|uniref:Uncharacterized protein n=1 Tax=Pleurodeles waltl TaxID=8319 RepID=A0AAV7L223_PLEWA|nr:hypothetical protein NDU88_005841 [Pleurodeles waltl]